MRGHCLTDGALIALHMNEATPREAEKSLRHLAVCSRCSVRFSVLRQVKRDLRPRVDSFAGDFGPRHAGPVLRDAAGRKLRSLGAHRPAGGRTSRGGLFGIAPWLRLSFGLIAVLAVVVAGAFLATGRFQSRSIYRSPSPRLALIEPAGPVLAPPAIFRWAPVAGAESYDLELIDEGLTLVYRGSTFLITERLIPAPVRQKLVKGSTYVWSVTAKDADGYVVTSRSGSFIIE